MRYYRLLSAQPWAILPAAGMQYLEILRNLPDSVFLDAAYANNDKNQPLNINSRASASFDAVHKPTTIDGVMEIPVRGPILRYADVMHAVCGGASVQGISNTLRASIDDPGIKAVVLHFDTPGGQANGVGELASQIRGYTRTKPIVGYVGGMACSAGYWLAAACTTVVTAPSATLGSIGAMLQLDTTKPKDVVTFISSQSPLKNADPETDEGAAEIKRWVDSLAAVFVASVATFRGVSTDTVLADFGKGGVFVGAAAVAAGLADSVGDFDAVVAKLVKDTSRAGSLDYDSKTQYAKTQHRGSTVMPMNFSRMFARVSREHPDIAAKAIAAEGADGDDDAAALTRAAGTLVVNEAPDPAATAAAVESRARAMAAQQMTTFYTTQAHAFFDGLVRAGKMAPADVPANVCLYVAFAAEDQLNPLTARDPGGNPVPVSRLALLTEPATSRSASRWTESVVGADATRFDGDFEGASFLPQSAPNPKETEISSARVLKMLQATSEGQSYLRRQQGK